MTLPTEFLARMEALLGADYPAFAEALAAEPVKALRVNPIKISADAFSSAAPFSLKPIPYAPGAFIVDAAEGAGKSPLHHAGAYYMQDPGAMAAAASLPDEVFVPGMRILDVCAAPGGKSTALAARAASCGGTLLANEYVASRARILAGNIERMGLSNVVVTNTDSARLAEWYPGYFHLVAADVPCSGEGMMRKSENAVTEWSTDNVKLCAARSAEILKNAAKCVAAGGYLLYSTCTYAAEENESLIAAFLDAHPSFSLVPVREEVRAHTADGIDVTGENPALLHCRRFYPHIAPGEGQFIALMRRDESDMARGGIIKTAAKLPAKADLAAAEAFLREALGHTLPGLMLCGGNLTAFDGDLPIPPAGVVSAGVTLGELRRGRIVPHHHLFMAYGKEFPAKLVLAPEDARVMRYLAGEEIESDAAGYTAVLLDFGGTHLTLGGGKSSGGRLKNYYPKGLRVR